jgi:glycosyltransferase involved in cell wall biosynthesis
MHETTKLTSPILTIGIITYNRSGYLFRMLDSILKSNLDFTNEVEILILDNGSTDDTLIQLQKYSGILRFKLIQQKNNIRGAETFEKIINSSNGKFMIIPGDDDCFYSEHLSKLIDTLKKNESDINLLTCFADVIDEKDNLLSITYRPDANNTQEKILAKLIFQSIFWLPATVFRRESLAEIDLSPSLIALDWSFWIETMTKGKYIVLETPIIKYRQHSNREQESYMQLTWDLDSFLMLENSINFGSFKDWFDTADVNSLNLFVEEILKFTKNRKFSNFEIALYLLICKVLHNKIDIKPLLTNLYENRHIKLDPRFTQTLFGTNPTFQDIDFIFNSIDAIFSYSGNNFKGFQNLNYFKMVESKDLYIYEWRVGSKANNGETTSLLELISNCLEVYNLIQRENRKIELKDTITPFESAVIIFLRKIRKIRYGRHRRKLKLRLRS